ncbi:putative bifunctional diguanylate cyclase/phosphodiesterase [Motilimonas pumila]|uniref:Bifunctional diguanylate cyclase/phosphodiesterase n=1 Tax=Motilimonas pumila TaxID=2303987 RepID=A0A418YAV4_9GAMM|nr:bifunctional diguanylate cyclase/phosphodiesterase [Motilimonas pumila]RJG40107.1 bifunctional diguanylate cyclase/phosphodiesterase [Motilimonas pumila]
MKSGINLGLGKKVMGVTFLLLLVIFTGYTYLNLNNLSNFFELERRVVFSYQKHQTQQYYEEIYSRVDALASQLQASNRISSVNLSNDKNLRRIVKEIRGRKSLPVNALLLVDPNGEVLARSNEMSLDRQTRLWIANAEQHNSEHWFVFCRNSCQVLFKSEAKFGAGNQLVFVLPFDKMQPLSTSDASSFQILLEQKSNGDMQYVFTRRVRNFDFNLLKQHLTVASVNRGEGNVNIGPRNYEFRGYKIYNTNLPGQAYFLIVNDISDLHALLKGATYNNVIYGVGALILAILLMLFLLRKPLRRIRHIIQSLPLLARSQHEEFRRIVEDQGMQEQFADESDELGQASISLSRQLQELEGELVQRADELEWLVNHDPLTELPNRRMFNIEIIKRLEQTEQGCLLFMDLDNFKYVNDISGHTAGDMMLTQVANTLEKLLPSNALLARISGDEFAIFLQDVDLGAAQVVAQRILQLISEVCVAGREEIHMASVSIGVVAYPEHGFSLSELLSKADIAMYQAKDLGKNRLAVYHSENVGSKVNNDWYWLAKAQRAIEENLLSLHFQPIYNNQTNSVGHWEVLLRVQDEKGELCSPYQLILAAEKNGYITQLDLWVINAALDQLLANHQRGIKQRLAINLSAKSFSDDQAIMQIKHAIVSRGVDGSQLIIEITETAALSNMVQAVEHINVLKSLGCEIALDDFGVGYSSFHSLKSLPLDYIKIDGSFVKDCPQRPDDQVFIKALIDIAHNFGHKTVAEFVENQEIQLMMASFGVDYSQGYYIGKPMPAEQAWPSTQDQTQKCH